MTAQDKRDRRQMRHDIRRQAMKVAARALGMYATAAQIKAAAKTMTDRVISKVVNG